MYIARYLLSIEEFMDTENGEALMERAFLCVDGERRKKAARIKPGRVQSASIGAGLLLQLAVREAVAAMAPDSGIVCGTACTAERNFCLRRYCVNQLLEALQDKPPLLLAYRYGKEGKPYLRDMPFYFNLSHSGEYVLCVIATEEIGADIQQHRLGKRERKKDSRQRECHRNCGLHGQRESNGKQDFHGQVDSHEKSDYAGRLAGRFFSERERAALEQAGGEQERERLFFRLWARKEAYGKLTGDGIAGVVDMDMLPEKDGDGALEKALCGENAVFCGEGAALCGENAVFCGEGAALWRENAAFCGESVTMVGRHSRRKSLSWEEYGGVEGYSIAICRYR
ncbi:MAG: 4'-phosphopantetheinyl transferase superfamily protein [Lachnospiraceae bacterium]|jgi:phosphopantetheinyl transferase|nr:4'-phosphopantetheinyl transferase superfamily protein [Lachnospiraceae bacterium]